MSTLLTQLKLPLEPQQQPLTFLHEYPEEKEDPGQSSRPRPRPPDSRAGRAEAALVSRVEELLLSLRR